MSLNTLTPAFGIGWRHPHYAELLETLPSLGFIEVHSENFFAEGGAAQATLRRARAHYPVSLHGVGLGLGSAAGIDDWHLDQLARLVKDIEPIRISDHACFARGSVAGQDVHASDLLPIAFNVDALNVMCANVQRVQDRLKRPILVENLSAYVTFNNNDRPETQFLNDVARRTGCGLLVDINNIYVNALNQQKKLASLVGETALLGPIAACIEWLDRIAPEVVGELHLAGHIDCGDVVIDDHGSGVCDAVWQIYQHAQQRFGSVDSLIEWDTDIPTLAVLLAEVERARSVHAALTEQQLARREAVA